MTLLRLSPLLVAAMLLSLLSLAIFLLILLLFPRTRATSFFLFQTALLLVSWVFVFPTLLFDVLVLVSHLAPPVTVEEKRGAVDGVPGALFHQAHILPVSSLCAVRRGPEPKSLRGFDSKRRTKMAGAPREPDVPEKPDNPRPSPNAPQPDETRKPAPGNPASVARKHVEDILKSEDETPGRNELD